MVMSSKKIGKMVGADVDKALESINMLPQSERMDKRAFRGPEIKVDETIKAAAAPSREMTRGELFRYTRMAAKAAGLDPSKQTFTYGGKTYNTRMAGESAKRPAAPTSGRSGTGASGRSNTTGPAVSAATSNFFKKLPTVGSTVSSMRGNPPAQGRGNPPAAPRGNPPAAFKMDARFLGAKIAPPPPPVKKDDFKARIESKGAPKPQPTRAERIKAEQTLRQAHYEAKQKAKADAERAAKAKRDAETKKRAAAFKKANTGWEFGAKLPGKAKGGKIDGIAIRGKTRAPLKKGK